MRPLVAFILVILTSQLAAAYDVAFIEMRDAHGNVLHLEKNGRFAHIALFYRGLWLHAHPYRGVELVPAQVLETMGTIKVIVRTPGPAEPSPEVVKSFLGKPYDHEFTWADDKIYCSELIAKILHIPPGRMHFGGDAWKNQSHLPENQPGLSPDDIFAIFAKNRFPARRPANSCTQFLGT